MSTHNLLKDSLTTYQAGILQATAHRMLQKHCDVILSPYDISKMQWLIIGAVLDSGPAGIRLTDLSRQLGTTISYITSAVKLLEAKNMLVSTDSAVDSRSKLITVHADFLPQCQEIEKTLRDGLRKSIYTHVKPEDLKIYMQVLQDLTRIEQ